MILKLFTKHSYIISHKKYLCCYQINIFQSVKLYGLTNNDCRMQLQVYTKYFLQIFYLEYSRQEFVESLKDATYQQFQISFKASQFLYVLQNIIFIMNNFDPILSERKKRKSISQFQYDIQNNINRLNPISQHLRQNNLADYPKQSANQFREPKKSIIKINKRKLPLDFFMSNKTDEIIQKIANDNDRNNRDFFSDLIPNQKKINSEKFIQLKGTYPLKNDYNKNFSQQEELKNTCFFGNPIYNSPQLKPSQIQNNDSYDKNSKNHFQRNFQTRSEQKREKLQNQQRKFTAINYSHKPDVLQLLPAYKEKIQGEINDMIVFTTNFAKEFKNISGRTSPTKQLLSPIKQRIQKKGSMQNKQKYLNLKLNTNFKSTMDSQKQIISPVKTDREIDSPLKKSKQLLSPTRKQKELNSPIKFISNYPDNYYGFDSEQKIKILKLNQIAGNNNTINLPQQQQMNITFANTKSTSLPPIIQNNIQGR